jgi:hypothetical protein
MKKIGRSLAASILFLCIFVIVYYVHVTFFKVDVIFYAAIADGFIATVLAGITLFTFKYFEIFEYYEKGQLIIIWILAGYTIAISVPTVIDRSLSFYILEKLQQRGGGIREDRFAEVFTKEYMKEHRLIDVRLTEQQASGTIIIDNGCVRLTEKGDYLATFSRYFRRHWLPKKRLLMDQYTDDLTDPFRNSELTPDYQC